jgi:hypothetical protein
VASAGGGRRRRYRLTLEGRCEAKLASQKQGRLAGGKGCHNEGVEIPMRAPEPRRSPLRPRAAFAQSHYLPVERPRERFSGAELDYDIRPFRFCPSCSCARIHSKAVSRTATIACMLIWMVDFSPRPRWSSNRTRFSSIRFF